MSAQAAEPSEGWRSAVADLGLVPDSAASATANTAALRAGLTPQGLRVFPAGD